MSNGPEYEQRPHSRLSLHISEAPYGWSLRQTWRDAKVQRLEGCLDNIVRGIVALSQARRQDAEESERERREAEETGRRRQEVLAVLGHGRFEPGRGVTSLARRWAKEWSG